MTITKDKVEIEARIKKEEVEVEAKIVEEDQISTKLEIINIKIINRKIEEKA